MTTTTTTTTTVTAVSRPCEAQRGSHFGPADDLYEIGEELGSGSDSRVFACRRCRTGEQFAVKVVSIHRLRLMGDLAKHKLRLSREVQILRQLRHERIVNLEDFHQTEDSYYLVMERVSGGELFNQIVLKQSLSEVEARHVFRQLLEGLGYLHGKSIIHRDIKPENILIVRSHAAEQDADAVLHDVKIADFGLSKAISDGASMARTCVGTPQYWAPEVLNTQRGSGTYDHAADFWGLGAVLFVMLSGRYPFDGRSKPLDEQIRTAAFSMRTPRWQGISDAAKSLVKGLLKVDPAERMQLEECLQHPWVLGTASLCTSLGDPIKGQKKIKGRRRRAPGVTTCQAKMEEEVVDAEPEEPTEPARVELPQRSASSTTAAGSSQCPSRVMTDPGDEAEECATEGVTPPQSWTRSLLAALAPLLLVGAVVFLWLVLPAMPPPPRITGFQAQLDPLGTQVALVPPSIFPATTTPSAPRNSVEAPPTDAPLQSLGAAVLQALQVPEALVGGTPVPGVPLAGAAAAVPGQAPQMGQPALQPLHVPLVQLHGASLGAGEACTEQESIFRLGELLKLQVSITGSLEMAWLAFRHADMDLADATRQTFRQARDLFQHAADVVSRYGLVAQQVRTTVLPDLRLAVEEQEPGLAADLLAVVKAWVSDMKGDADSMRARYAELQQAVLHLVSRAQRSKLSADQRLAEAIRAAEGNPSDSFALELQTSVCTSAAAAAGGQAGARAGAGAPSLGSATRDLFERLRLLSNGLPGGANPGPGPGHEEAWKQSVLDLLFMAPGVTPFTLPPVEPLNFTGEGGALPQKQLSDSRASRSAAALVQALRELRRVDMILHGCSTFWANMDSTVKRLAQMKDVTERLVGFATHSARLRERFEQRLGEYGDFWALLERLCRQYALDHHAALTRMQEFVRGLADAADVIDTAESARVGALAARWGGKASQGAAADGV